MIEEYCYGNKLTSQTCEITDFKVSVDFLNASYMYLYP